MSGFCPYSEEVEIDFDVFDGSGLFLITGETGAGKTTIFDGISFALFGEVSGENRGNDMLRSDFAKPETQTFVKLVFEDKGNVYEIERNPKYNRPVKRGDSGRTTVQNADAKIFLPDNGVITGAKEVTEKVVSLLGINHQQYKQISMVAQGEFLKLLFANSEDRGKIFRKVFGTELYERIQKDLKNQTNSFKKELEDIDKAIFQYYDGIICEGENEDYESYLNLKGSVHGLTEMLLLLESLVKKSVNEKRQKTDEAGKVQKQLDESAQEIINGEQINVFFKDLKNETEKSLELKNRDDEINNQKKTLEMGKLATYQVKPKYEDFKRLEKQSSDLVSNIKKNSHIIEENNPQKQARQKELEKLQAEEPQREALITEIQNIENSLPEYEKLANTELELKKIEKERKILYSEYLSLNDTLIMQKTRVAEIQNELGVLKGIETKKMELEQKQAGLLKEKDDLTDLKKNAKTCQKIEKEYKSKQKDCKKKELKYSIFKQKFDDLERLFYCEQAGILAETLSKNKPCPVCGSLKHPDKAKKSSEAPSQENLNKEKKAQEELRSIWQESSEDCKSLKTKYDTKLDQLNMDSKKLKFEKYLSVDELLELIFDREKNQKKVIEKVDQDFINAEAEYVRKVSLEKAINDLQNKNVLDEEEINKKKETLSEIAVSVSSLRTQIMALKDKLKFENKKSAENMIKQKQDELDKMKSALVEAQTVLQIVSDQIKKATTLKNADSDQLKKTSKEQDEAKQLLALQLKQCGFENLKAYEGAYLTEEKIHEIEAVLKKYNLEITETTAKIQQLEKQINGREKIDIKALEDDKKKLIVKQKEVQREQENIEHIIKNNEGILKELEVKADKREEVERTYSEIKILSDTANGELSGKQKLAFEQYVQGVYFDMILAEANKRFGTMSDGRYSLVRKDGGNKQSKSGLDIDVQDKWTSKTRSVKSLSGGESFKASLSLALGLSDIVQNFSGGVQLNTMFIDEGFGSLDSESLEKAMDILAGLTEGDRLVGIISHLDELKEKIDKKIIISRDPQGSSICMQI